MPRHHDDPHFAIALSLLADSPHPLAWSNLGYWATTTDYHTAAEQLALHVGHAAALLPTHRVLDVGCGHGASLQLWPSAFGVQHVTAIERQTACVDAIRASAPPALDAVYQARFDQLPAPAALPAHDFDAVLCVDAAYHATALDDFVAFAAAQLASSGRLVFTTLMQTPAFLQASSPQQAWVQQLLRLAGIPAASFLTTDAVIATLARHGLTDITLQPLDAEVLQGFADFVQRRQHQLHWRQRLGPAWWKIRTTAWLCAYLYRHQLAHYMLIKAVSPR